MFYKKNYSSLLAIFMIVIANVSLAHAQASLKSLLEFPFPDNLCSAPASNEIAWTFDIKGSRNIYFLKGNNVSYQQLTHDTSDDGQQISDMSFSENGQWLVYARGGAPEGNWSNDVPVNPASYPLIPPIEIRSVEISTGKNYLLAKDGSSPLISPDSKRVLFIRNNKEVWSMPVDSSSKPSLLFETRGSIGSLRWSPDGKRLAFVADRGDHSFIGVYIIDNAPVQWIDPTFSRDVSPRWSPTGDSIVFVRMPAIGGAPDSILRQYPRPWEIRIADIQHTKSVLLWKSPNTLRGSVPTTNGGFNLHWAANNRIIFLSTQDNWPHLYSISVTGGEPLLLTPGDFTVEYISLAPDKMHLIFSSNTGPDKLDIDRRHIGMVSVDKQDMKIITPGDGIEAHCIFKDDHSIAFISSNAYRPPLPALHALGQGKIQVIGHSLLSSVYSPKYLVKPTQVIFKSIDGTLIHGQLFLKPGGAAEKPAVLCIHGGPMRQMLLGWNYMDYYANHYAVNQWLANHGFVVLSVNYRMGIGYGNDFHHPAHADRRGASEYQDILAAGEWLAKQPEVDAKRIGVYGGSYGGFLTAMALGKNSGIFCAGVDISGVHDHAPEYPYTAKFEHAPDAALADTVAWLSSPVAYINTWTSPVLIIHSDDDRNVEFSQSVDLAKRLQKKGVPFEELVIPDDTHDWIKFQHLVRVYEATVDFLERKVMDKK
jgi:dipeptidyl aminopeptidase/acylaminoacyl peptidase